MVHDKCYDAAMADKKCNIITEYTAMYDWQCDTTNSTDGRGIPECLGLSNDLTMFFINLMDS